MWKKLEINALFFSLFCSLLLSLTFSHPIAPKPLFFLYGTTQVLLETALCIAMSFFLKKWLLAGGCFFLLLFHYVDFIMVRLKDATITYVLKYFLGLGIDHFIVAFDALHFDFFMTSLILLPLFLVPFLGWLFYRCTERFFPCKLSFGQVAIGIGALLSSLCALNLLAYFHLPEPAHDKYAQRLPLGGPFFKPAPEHLVLTTPFRTAQERLAAPIPDQVPASLPNIYFFIIETLRRDFVNRETAPSLTAFSETYGSFQHSFANANATHLSWFALLHGALPYQWVDVRDHWTQGAPSLQWLKKLGYEIRVYTSTDLNFFDMDQVLFGKGQQLIDFLEKHTANEPCERDTLVIQSAIRDLKSHPNKTLFLFFLESTHTEYSVPKDWPCRFVPVIEKIDYLTIQPNSLKLEGLKNRYRNAIDFIDQLTERFFSALRQEGLFDSGVIALTGDHGEEFFEEGELFHGSHLNVYQTSVPILLKAGSWPAQTNTITHIDLFPSIFHFLTGQSDFGPLFDGQSVFQPGPRRDRMTVMNNGYKAPREFTLEQADKELHARFTDDPLILEIKKTRI